LKEQSNMEKCEKSFIKKNEKSETVQKKAKIHEYRLKKIKEKLDEKSIRVHEFKSQKLILSAKRNEMRNEVLKKKEEYMAKFNELMKKYAIKVSF